MNRKTTMHTKLHKRLRTAAMTELQPTGWLRNQLQIQMDGLTGRLYDIWDSVGSYSGWLGGTGENWERAPYYLDGLIPLAYYLDDRERWNLCLRFVEWTLNSQDETGNFGPETSKADYWSRYAMMKALIQYGEITDDPRVVPFCRSYILYAGKAIVQRPVSQWSKARVGDFLYCAAWVYEQQPSEDILEAVAAHRAQALDWGEYFARFPFTRPAAYYYNWGKVSAHHGGRDYDDVIAYHATHIVNVTQGMKYPAMLYQFDQDTAHYANVRQGMDVLRQYHGVASGAVNGDEHLSGNSPSQGAELCSVVEYMFSLQCILETFGDPQFADQLERLAYNALPATITEDFLAHQYLQQANQIAANQAERNWFNNDETANMFGLEPHFGCCTANMHQGWPKYVKSLWYRDEADNIVSMAFAPCRLTTKMGGKHFDLELETEYPFRNRLTYRILSADQVEGAIRVRLPGWCPAPETEMPDGIHMEQQDGFLHFAGVWNTGDHVTVILPMEVRSTHWYRDSMAVERGPLVYALDMQEDWQAVRTVAGVNDYAVTSPSPWNYALAETPQIRVEEGSVGPVPFSKKDSPVSMRLKGRRVTSWGVEDNSAAPVPQSPVHTSEPDEDLRLIPFGCTKLRISQFPFYAGE